MAHFAQLDENNIVIQVIVVGNDDCCDVNGIESEEIGISFCKKIMGLNTKWKQTSYNSNIRARYAGIGYSYNEALDAFIAPQPYPSWSLNNDTASWEAPVTRPTLTAAEIEAGHYHLWDEDNQNWELHIPDPQN